MEATVRDLEAQNCPAPASAAVVAPLEEYSFVGPSDVIALTAPSGEYRDLLARGPPIYMLGGPSVRRRSSLPLFAISGHVFMRRMQLHGGLAKALAGHAWKRHSVESVAYPYASDDGTCPVCMKLFGSRLKVVAHLRRSSLCLLNHIAYDLAPTDIDRRLAVQTQLGCQRGNRGQGRPLDFSRVPTLTLEGPLMPLFRSDTANAMSTSRRLSSAMSSAAVISLDTDQFAGIGYSLMHSAAREALTDWTLSERSYEEAMRALPDVDATPV